MPHLQDGVSLAAAQMQVAVVEEELYSMILGRDWIGVLLGNTLHHGGVFDVHLVPAGRTRFRTRDAAHDQ